ncbi:serine/threonine protein kinase PkaE [Actinocorallia lasiicapitis]
MTEIAGRYRLDEPIGRGGMGEVWAATDQRLRRRVAVKLISGREAPDEQLSKRFVRECMITARLDHPGVPVVYDSGVDGERLFLVMQLVQGVNLDYLDEPLPIGWAAAIGAQIAAVLGAAHRQSIVHRDLKPSNLMITPDGAVKVLDFGLAKALQSPDDSRITFTGQQLGTWLFMAPEQFTGGPVGPWTDLYALGCVLHYLLAGEAVFGGDSDLSMHRHLTERPASLRSIRRDVPEELAELVLSLLAKEPGERPTEVYDVLLAHASDLRALPGMVGIEESALRRYAAVLAKIGGRAGTLEEADELFDAGRYAEAALAYRAVGTLTARLREANCHEVAGDRPAALTCLQGLVGEALREYGPDDSRTLELRRRIGFLLAATGQSAEAVALLRRLVADFERVHGPDSALVTGLRADTAKITRRTT